jgi:hypothetical protein
MLPDGFEACFAWLTTHAAADARTFFVFPDTIFRALKIYEKDGLVFTSYHSSEERVDNIVGRAFVQTRNGTRHYVTLRRGQAFVSTSTLYNTCAVAVEQKCVFLVDNPFCSVHALETTAPPSSPRCVTLPSLYVCGVCREDIVVKVSYGSDKHAVPLEKHVIRLADVGIRVRERTLDVPTCLQDAVTYMWVHLHFEDGHLACNLRSQCMPFRE